MEFKELNLEEKKKRSENILKLFIISTDDCIYQINTTKKLIDKVLERVEECPEDLFDEMVDDLISQTLCTVYMRFSNSEIYEEMIKSTQTSFHSKVIFIGEIKFHWRNKTPPIISLNEKR
jgi:hypothetical protein